MRIKTRQWLSISGRVRLIAALVVWIASVGAGMAFLTAYVNRAGATGIPPQVMSISGGPASHKYRLLMFVHPHCPCTTASLSELSRVMSRCSNQIKADVYFYCPDDKPDEWVTGNLWNSARAIPGVEAWIDRNALASTEFATAISGEVLLYDPVGHLCFHGGITAGRGHEGDNAGKTAVISMARKGRANVDHAPVFGCIFRPVSTNP